MSALNFPKSQRLCSKTVIDKLFLESKSFFVYPYKIVYSIEPCATDAPSTVQALFVVPKRKFKKAVNRNPIKRKAKEAYRLQKCQLISSAEELGLMVRIAVIYVASESKEFSTHQKSIQKVIEKIINLMKQVSSSIQNPIN